MKSVSTLLMLLLAWQVMAGPYEKERNTLGLTAEQKEQMKAVKQRQHDRLQAARQEIMAQSKTEMAEFLTTEQLAQVENMEQHRKEHKHLRKQHKKMKRQGRRNSQESD